MSYWFKVSHVLTWPLVDQRLLLFICIMSPWVNSPLNQFNSPLYQYVINVTFCWSSSPGLNFRQINAKFLFIHATSSWSTFPQRLSQLIHVMSDRFKSPLHWLQSCLYWNDPYLSQCLCSVLPIIPSQRIIRQMPISTNCNTLQQAAIHCNTLQHTATHCSTLQHTATDWLYQILNHRSLDLQQTLDSIRDGLCGTHRKP